MSNINCPKCSQTGSIALKTISLKDGRDFEMWKCGTLGCGMSIPKRYFNVEFTEDEATLLLEDYAKNYAVKKEDREGVIKKTVKFPKKENEADLFLCSELDEDPKYKKYIISFSTKINSSINQNM